MDTEYGKTSDLISIGRISGRKVAFIPRHGKKHTIPPHKVPYRANIDALSMLGVKRIISTNAVGSLNKDYAPGDFALFDQFVNMTHGRDDSYFNENKVVHISPAEPYCNELRNIALAKAKELRIKNHSKGTVVVINGPRFSTKAESRFFKNQGFELIGMTQYPEVVLAKERGICYMGIGIVTDYDVGIEGSEHSPVNAQEVTKVFGKSVNKAKDLIMSIIPSTPQFPNCNCSKSLEGAVISQ